MSPVPMRDTPEGRAYNDVRNLARNRGRDVSEYLALYALEGFLDRLTRSEYAPDLVLKGGVLMTAFAARRPTRDIDIQATSMANDVAEVEAMIAIIAAIERGIANTRWRDFVDINSIADTTSVTADDLAAAIRVVSDFRHVTWRPLAEVLRGMSVIAQPKWTAWRRKQRLAESTPEQFQQVIDACIAFADPVLTGDAAHAVWMPATRAWMASEQSYFPKITHVTR